MSCKDFKKQLTKQILFYIIKYGKGKTSNGYAKSGYVKNNALLGGGRYFFMVNANESSKIIIKDIM